MAHELTPFGMEAAFDIVRKLAPLPKRSDFHEVLVCHASVCNGGGSQILDVVATQTAFAHERYHLPGGARGFGF